MASEQFVAQQLRIRHEPYYWTASGGSAEIDFVIQRQNDIIPIAVKAEENLNYSFTHFHVIAAPLPLPYLYVIKKHRGSRKPDIE